MAQTQFQKSSYWSLPFCADLWIIKSIIRILQINLHWIIKNYVAVLEEILTILFLKSFVYSWQEFSASTSEIKGAWKPAYSW